jgi:hypothetical protein
MTTTTIHLNPAALIKTGLFLMVGFAAAYNSHNTVQKNIIAKGGHVVNEADIPACQAATLGAPDFQFQRSKCRSEIARLSGKPANKDAFDLTETPRWREQCLDGVQNEAEEIRALGRIPETDWIEQKRQACAVWPTRAELDADNAKYAEQQRQYLSTLRSTGLRQINSRREYCLKTVMASELNTERQRILESICQELPATPAPSDAIPTKSPRENCLWGVEEDHKIQNFTEKSLKERRAVCDKLPGPAPTETTPPTASVEPAAVSATAAVAPADAQQTAATPAPEPAKPKKQFDFHIRKPGTSGFKTFDIKDF